MSNVNQPPSGTEIVDTKGNAPLPWLTFFENLYIGDVGTSWTPTYVNLTEVGGSATKTGKYYRISQNLYFIVITLTPATSVSATAGSTYMDNFPLTLNGDSPNFGVVGTSGVAGGVNVASNNRIYLPTISAATGKVTIVGLVEAV